MSYIAAAAIIGGDSKKEEPTLPDEDPAGKDFLQNLDVIADLESLLKKLFHKSREQSQIRRINAEFGIRMSKHQYGRYA